MSTGFGSLPQRAVVGLAFGGVLLASACSSGAVSDKPNIIVFLVDDMGLMDSSVPMLTDEDGKAPTPPAQRLVSHAEHGTAGRDGHPVHATSYAHSVCSPTRISIMTGQNAARHRTTDYINPWQDNRTLDNEGIPPRGVAARSARVELGGVGEA